MWKFHCPVKLYAGENALSVLETFRASRVMVVTDAYFSQNGLAMAIGSRVPGAQVKVFDQVVPDPPASLAAEGAALCRSFRPELLIALGGGSPMDCAKAIRLASEQTMRFVAIPTTSGSGSEMTSFSILTHRGVKHPLVDEAMRPDAAILDPSLLENLPEGLAAETGMDLLAHCLEALAALDRSPVTDALAFYGVETVLGKLEASCHGDRSVRGELHAAASMAGMAFDQAGLGVCHAMAHALGGEFHLPHGRLCAMLLPHVLRINGPAAGAYAQAARRCGLSAPTEKTGLRSLCGAIARLRQQLRLPGTLKEAGIPEDKLASAEERVVSAAMADRCCETNPVPVTESLLRSLYRAVGG